MKVCFVFTTRATGLMVHLLPDVMFIVPSDGSRAIVIGVLNMHLSFKFYRKEKALEDTMLYQAERLETAYENARGAICSTELVQAIAKLAQLLGSIFKKGGVK